MARQRYYVYGDAAGALQASFGQSLEEVVDERESFVGKALWYPVLYELVPVSKVEIKRRLAKKKARV